VLNVDEELVNIWPSQAGKTMKKKKKKTHDNYGYINHPGVKHLYLRGGKYRFVYRRILQGQVCVKLYGGRHYYKLTNYLSD
jgi:hypothetical protein